MNISATIVQLIQAMLAPGVMINACGLLLLGMNNKYSLVTSRIRVLNEEKRKFFKKAGEEDLSFEDNIRLKSIAMQIEKLRHRVMLVRNAVFCYSCAVAVFVLTAFNIGLFFYTGNAIFEQVSFGFFLTGMLTVLVGVIFAAIETIKGYDIIVFEIDAD